MTTHIRLWVELDHHGAFQIGGWAWLRDDGVSISGEAGGARQSDLERTALSALIAALRGCGAAAVQMFTCSPSLAALPLRLEAAASGGEAPSANLELWAQASTLVGGRVLEVIQVRGATVAPSAFVASWAGFARDRAKGRGAFAAPIPKSNLAKSGVGSA